MHLIRFQMAALILASGVLVTAASTAAAAPKVYVGNFADNTVSVIDSQSDKVVATVPVVAGPHGMAISADGRTVYVTGDASSAMSVIDTSTDTVARTVEVGKAPNGIALTPDGKQLLVTVNGDDKLAFLDTASQTMVGSVSVPKPHTVVVTPDGKLAYVTSQAPGDAALVVVDVATRTVMQRIPLDKIPRDGEFGYDGKAFYFTEAGVDAIQVLDPASNKIVAQIATGSSPHFAKLFRGTVLAMAIIQGPGQVLFFDPKTNQPAWSVNVGKQPHWIALSGDAKTAYVPNEGSNDVSVIDLATGKVSSVAVGKAPRKVVVQQVSQQASASGASITIAGFAFGPSTASVHVGDPVTWTNNDGAIHTVTFKDGSAGATALSPSQTFTRTFDRAGTYEYFCSIHPYMTGTVTVSL